MTSPADENPDRLPDWHNPFDDLRTVPGGWDPAGLTPRPPETPAPQPVNPPRRRTAPRFRRPGRLDIPLN